MIRPILILASCLAFACASDIPGLDPAGDELYFPIGMAVIPDQNGEPAHLAVVSSNFDQRYNSGSITTYSIDQLFALANCASTMVPEPCFIDVDANGNSELRKAQTGFVRVFSFGNDLLYVPRSATTGRLFTASRGRNRLTMVKVDTGNSSILTCQSSGEGIEIASGSDCSRAYVVNTGFPDPLALAYMPANGNVPESVAVGHVATRSQGDITLGSVSLVNLAQFEERIMIEGATQDDAGLPEPVETSIIADFGGVSGMVFAGNILGLENVFLTANFNPGPSLLVTSFVPSEVARVNPDDPIRYRLELKQGPGQGLQLDANGPPNGSISAIELRSLAIASNPSRAYASVRFFAQNGTFNSGVAVIDTSSSALALLSVLEFGEELMSPFLREVTTARGTSRLVYISDLRRDAIFILDVTNDRPVLVSEIPGRTVRQIDGESVQVRLLDGPSQMQFVTHGPKTLGFVTNFGNSTLAVLDVTDPSPALHRLVARIGRNIDSEGKMEEP